MNTFTWLFLIALVLSLVLKLWLSHRQISHVTRHRPQVPDEFAGRIPLHEHQKAADYTTTNSRFGRFSLIIDTLLLIGWTLGGGLQFLHNLWSGLSGSPIMTGIAFIVSAFMLMGLLDLPATLYHTFVIEERFGFNKMTVPTFFSDLLKQTALTLAFGVPLAWVALTLMDKAGSLWWLYLWAVWMGFSLLMMWAYPAFIAPLFNKFTPLEDDALKNRIQTLLTKCGFTSQGIFVMDGSRRSGHGNAYFTGMGNNKRIVFFDTLLESLDEDEIEAVLAHELGHFKRKHIVKRIFSMMVISLAGLALLGWLTQQDWFFNGLGAQTTSNAMALMLFLLVSPVFTLFMQPISAWFSRKQEFEADDYAASQSDASKLIQALVKLYKENASTLTPDPLYSAFYDSHPPAPVRIAHLSG
ncbi:MAG: M48 family metallopeptidase, partial [Gammaproteobacteria bacterium]